MKLGTRDFLIFVSAISCIAVLDAGCVHKPDVTDLPDVCFENDILPVFRNSCALAGCHDGSGESDMRLSTFQEISRGIEPYKPQSSKIYKAITATSGEDQMPPDQPLSQDNRTLIRIWIEQGAKNTACQGLGKAQSPEAFTK